jgi:hypothetical protein
MATASAWLARQPSSQWFGVWGVESRVASQGQLPMPKSTYVVAKGFRARAQPLMSPRLLEAAATPPAQRDGLTMAALRGPWLVQHEVSLAEPV